MTLTVVVGSSGSGKTTFLEHVHKLHSCTYIRQYHTLRPYVPVKKIPRFDPTQLPYWKLYSDKELKESGGKKNESYNPGVKIGGTMAGEFTAGLSGGQRKMMLFELVRQRVSGQSDLLIVLDELPGESYIAAGLNRPTANLVEFNAKLLLTSGRQCTTH